MRIKLLIFLSWFIFSFSCTPEKCKLDTSFYEFEIPVELTPYKEFFQIGDTITLEATFSDLVYENVTKRTYLLKDKLFHPYTQIVRIDTSKHEGNALKYFDINYDENYISYDSIGTSRFLYGQYQYSENYYYLKIRFIPQQRGLYFLRHFNRAEIERYIEFDEKCPNMGVKVFVNLNTGNSNYMDLIYDCEDDMYKDWVLTNMNESYLKSCGYCFYVK